MRPRRLTRAQAYAVAHPFSRAHGDMTHHRIIRTEPEGLLVRILSVNK